MSRDFGKIRSSIWQSRKFLNLESDQARLLYFYLHTCPHGNSVGCFRLPKGYAMTDLGWPIDAIDRAIEALCEVGLIGWDEGENVVRLVDFLKHSGITNQKHAAGALKAAVGLPDCTEKQLLFNELAETPFIDKEDLPKVTVKQPDRPIDRSIPTETNTNTETNTSVPNGTAEPPNSDSEELMRWAWKHGAAWIAENDKVKPGTVQSFLGAHCRDYGPLKVATALAGMWQEARGSPDHFVQVRSMLTARVRNGQSNETESVDLERLTAELRTGRAAAN